MHPALPPLRSERLLLRAISAQDAEAMQSYRGRVDVTRYLLHPPLSLAETQARIAQSLERWSEYPAERLSLSFAIELADADGESGGALPTIIGDLRLWNLLPDASANATADPHSYWLGYALHPDVQGKGYAFEAASRAMAWLCAERHAIEIRAISKTENAASVGLLLKLGFVLVTDAERTGSGALDEVELRFVPSPPASAPSPTPNQSFEES